MLMPNLLLDAIAPGDIRPDHPGALLAFILVLAVIAVVTAVITRKRKK